MRPTPTHVRPETAASASDSLSSARAALVRGAWDEARVQLLASIAERETPEALEDLGLAAWWLDDAALTFDARERAYALYREREDALGAARVAVWLVWDCLAFRGDFAVASGWLERARRLLEGHEGTAEYGWLLLREGEVALFRGHDPGAAIGIAARAASLGRARRDRGIEFTALALEGLARVSTGDVDAGLRCLDEAAIAATAGEVKELHAIGVVCCWQIFACERVRDYDRAAQWCARVEEFTRRWRLHPLSAVCRTQYAGVLIWRGNWAEAEAELAGATRDLEQSRPAMTAPSVARLGFLRLRQGRLDEAGRLFEQSAGSAQAQLGRAELALERGDATEAAAQLEVVLNRVGKTASTERAAALELMVRAQARRDDAAAVASYFTELNAIATAVGTAPYLASSAVAEGILLRLRGETADAIGRFERAVELFQQNGAPFETARARLQLADALAALGRKDAADREARLALEIFESLGAGHEMERARRTLRAGNARRAESGPGAEALTPRQIEILRFVAKGLSNSDIASRLGLSEHTVKRHVANLLTRLDLSSRAAAAVYAAREGLL
ncbi:MAG TPA: LuxR C-terminal-related transcriptional regulator [Gemmatimonadaceae bacterium]